ncbi:MAG TPA: hypothetical protein VEW04_10110 [Allosphingosinicella sp.]|nr:hypothetical protein [Allosphingosinicella sp.]
MILVLALIAAEPATGETSSTPNPNEMICRSIRQIGSRLARERRCVTRAQWEEDQRNQRNMVENGQNQQVNPQLMTPGERAVAGGRYLPVAARGGAGSH